MFDPSMVLLQSSFNPAPQASSPFNSFQHHLWTFASTTQSKYGGATCDIDQPSSTLLGDFKSELTKNEPQSGSCCIAGSLIYDITDLVCLGGACDPYVTKYSYDGYIKVKDLGYGYEDALAARNELSCLCCSGKSIILPDFGGYDEGRSVTGTSVLDAIDTGLAANGTIDFSVLEEAAAKFDDGSGGVGARSSGEYTKKFKLYCHELPITPDYSPWVYLKKVLGACPTGY